MTQQQKNCWRQSSLYREHVTRSVLEEEEEEEQEQVVVVVVVAGQ
jgi:hypothetical protein